MKRDRKVSFLKDRLKEEMKKRHIRQKDLAEMLCLQPDTIKAAFRDQKMLPEHLQLIAKRFHINPKWLTDPNTSNNNYEMYLTHKDQECRLTGVEFYLDGLTGIFSQKHVLLPAKGGKHGYLLSSNNLEKWEKVFFSAVEFITERKCETDDLLGDGNVYLDFDSDFTGNELYEFIKAHTEKKVE